MADNVNLMNMGVEHIGDAPHRKRNLLLLAGIVLGGGLMGLIYWHWGQSDSAAAVELQRFREQMATQCKQEQFARPPQKGLSTLYADSSRMQAVVHAQLGNLQRGNADCDQILKSIRSVDFPVE